MVSYEMDQKGKHLRLDRHGSSAAIELESLRVEVKLSE